VNRECASCRPQSVATTPARPGFIIYDNSVAMFPGATSNRLQFQRHRVDSAAATLTVQWPRSANQPWDPPKMSHVTARILLLLTLSILKVVAQPVISIQPESVTVAATYSAVIRVTATGGALNYEWHKDGLSVAGAANNPLYLFPATEARHAGKYRVVIHNGSGGTTSGIRRKGSG
jgi:hypothetical protein